MGVSVFAVTLWLQSLSVDQHPLPKADDLFDTLAGGRKFTKLGLPPPTIVPESQSTVNTRREHSHVWFTSPPALYQKVMDTILQGATGVMCYIDNILVTGATEEKHLVEEFFDDCKHMVSQRSRKVLCHARDRGVPRPFDRCDWERPTRAKIAAIKHAPMPKNVQQFLGLLHYYHKLLPTILQPLNDLLTVTWMQIA